MIGSAIELVGSQLNQHLRRHLSLTEDVVEVSHILEQDGTLVPDINNKLVLFLVNIEKDTSAPRVGNGTGAPTSARAVEYPPVHLNLYLMVAAHFPGRNYREALKFISGAIAFFQGHPVFTHANSPDLDPGIQRLVLDIENLGFQELSHLWGVLGGKYLPSIMYRMRMVTVDSGDLARITPSLREPSASVSSEGA